MVIENRSETCPAARHIESAYRIEGREPFAQFISIAGPQNVVASKTFAGFVSWSLFTAHFAPFGALINSSALRSSASLWRSPSHEKIDLLNRDRSPAGNYRDNRFQAR
jgi:hypothetical protein